MIVASIQIVGLAALIAVIIATARAVGGRLRTNRKTGSFLVRYDGQTPFIERRK